ncbi:MAG TPA: nucleotidyltransferase family protein [Gemmataceae bacterium]|nr:nucleotidyltransferase family protein [Gemmataceae bacterium]
MVFALLPAAGQSSRMGRPKLSLPLGDRTILEQVVRTFHEGGVREVLVVLNPAGEELAALAKKAGAHALVLADATADMRATVEHGLDWLEARFRPKPDDLWMLCPADHPVLEAGVIRQLLTAWENRGDNDILIPVCNGQRGHPAVIAWRHHGGLRAFSVDLGLNVYLRQHADQTLEVPVKSDSILFDLDTPEDYVRLLQRWE